LEFNIATRDVYDDSISNNKGNVVESEAIMLIEVLAVMFIPSIVINALCWIMMNKHIKARDKKLRDDVVSLIRDLDELKCKHGRED
jgi:hypothetical protein